MQKFNEELLSQRVQDYIASLLRTRKEIKIKSYSHRVRDRHEIYQRIIAVFTMTGVKHEVIKGYRLKVL